ncbi:MAG: hypothetical protein QN167_05035 [Armatimonadota bacterium]|nr:hypothetical protein [Armatimonadota bacterium]
MEITVSEQKVFLVAARLTPEQARERAWDHKMVAFGSLSRLLHRPKGDEITVAAIEKRYEPVWHLAARKRLVFERGREYRVPVGDATVRAVTVAGTDYPVADGPPRHFIVRGVEHCTDDVRVEQLVDARSGAELQAPQLLTAAREEVEDLAALAPADAVVVPPEVKASQVVQRLVQRLLTPYEADQVFEEGIQVEFLHLLYRPVFAFEYVWQARGKRGVVELDGVTGEATVGTGAFQQQVRRIFNREVLFDLGAETVNLVVPGGAIPLKIGKAIMDRQRSKTGSA